MNLWDYLDRRAQRRQQVRLARAKVAGKPHRIDARGWIGIAVFGLTLTVIGLMLVPQLRADEFFKTIATLIIGAFIKDVVGWAYQATKSGGELAQRNAALVEEQVRSSPPIDDKGNSQ